MKKRQAQAKPEARDIKQSAHEIALHVVAILQNPHTPRELRDGLYDTLIDMENEAQILGRITKQPSYIKELIESFVGGAR